VTLQEFGLLLLSVLAGTAGQFFLKTGATKLAQVDAANLATKVFGIFLTPELLVGLSCYAMGAVSYILLLGRGVKLSVAAPAVALGYVFSVAMGHFVFRETIPLTRIFGLGLIVCGVVLVIREG